mmetsp:Transcript_13508/g.18501  ORF Transcript_13508/g.18501 Transcript_13508/m.18501 type:complete len:94 (-) Transcript_13508:506-787(-)|eukprot:CAMPEP_0185599294 /NCGR_PEP_ID=MMETSP0434-20130131/82589_1 /TAXON_ID=626734 ORGANISM="Favella taraikaensis, Strain Fe Narragansett Bay" /NCGR_SAMPLE_ID=MMETSP0434 /ASSEMBLY_ACC=CAM_ASM_000379 /LENGTH=93 /DNA_ID=CAMNT_0028228613 /DNA_START=2164 /DNA_END=2445 /DNA_ORIENTATION=-
MPNGEGLDELLARVKKDAMQKDELQLPNISHLHGSEATSDITESLITSSGYQDGGSSNKPTGDKPADRSGVKAHSGRGLSARQRKKSRTLGQK